MRLQSTLHCMARNSPRPRLISPTWGCLRKKRGRRRREICCCVKRSRFTKRRWDPIALRQSSSGIISALRRVDPSHTKGKRRLHSVFYFDIALSVFLRTNDSATGVFYDETSLGATLRLRASSPDNHRTAVWPGILRLARRNRYRSIRSGGEWCSCYADQHRNSRTPPGTNGKPMAAISF